MSGEKKTEDKNGVPLQDLSTETTSEKAELVERSHRVTLEQAHKYQVAVLVVAWISVITTLALGILSIVHSSSDHSSAAFAFGLDALLDTLSSIVVVWRFTGNSGYLYSGRREKLACTVIGILFLGAAIAVTVRASYSLAANIFPSEDDLLWKLSFLNGTTCLVLSIAKFFLGWKLESVSVITDGFNSLIGGILGYGTAASILIYTDNHNVWYLDAVCGQICAFMLLIYGVWLIYSTRKGLE